MSNAFQVPTHEVQDIFVNCWMDASFRAKFKANPREILSDWGIKVPDDIEIRVSEDASNIRHIVIPMEPTPDEINSKTSRPTADACVMSACRPCASFKDRGTAV